MVKFGPIPNNNGEYSFSTVRRLKYKAQHLFSSICFENFELKYIFVFFFLLKS